MSTIAVLTEQLQHVSINQRELESVLTRPITVGQSIEGLFISSQRDQINAIVSGIKTNVQDLSGRQAFSESKIPRVLRLLTDMTGAKVTAYGVNFGVTLPCSKPGEWIRDNILSSLISQKTEKTLVGGAATLVIQSGHKIWTIRLDPGDSDRISVDFNAHEETTQLPDDATLRKELQEQFYELLQFLGMLGL